MDTNIRGTELDVTRGKGAALLVVVGGWCRQMKPLRPRTVNTARTKRAAAQIAARLHDRPGQREEETRNIPASRAFRSQTADLNPSGPLLRPLPSSRLPIHARCLLSSHSMRSNGEGKRAHSLAKMKATTQRQIREENSWNGDDVRCVPDGMHIPVSASSDPAWRGDFRAWNIPVGSFAEEGIRERKNRAVHNSEPSNVREEDFCTILRWKNSNFP